jgi:uncharacterized protein YggU (UPF0235/DUF167 family)
LRIALRVTPRARRPGVGGLAPGRDGHARLKVGVTAAPEDGAANAAVIALLARTAHLPKSAFTLIAGATDRDKTVRVAGAPDDLAQRFRPLALEGTSR